VVTRELARAPQRIGHAASFGFGDRTGQATPGHVRALRRTRSRFVPVFAQQSARELERTRRTFADVLAAAARGVEETGWSEPWGADADHLRTPEEVRSAVDAGFTMLTLDPSAHVGKPDRDLDAALRELPWDALEDDLRAMQIRHAAAGTTEEVARAAALYGRALAHVVALARTAAGADVDIEVSIDETPLATTPFAHRFLVVELRRRGVPFTSIAPRFAGDWHKALDIRGDRDAIRRSIEAHAEIARELGGYKLSVHSGSDKFSAYPLLAEATDDLHVKTSGTSYLEALRVIAAEEPELFAAIVAAARDRFEDDRTSYELAAGAGIPREVDDPLGLLDDPGPRQALHVTYGAVLTDPEIAPALHAALDMHADEYGVALERHFARHLEAFR
jgi:tagaturonate epimerase